MQMVGTPFAPPTCNPSKSSALLTFMSQHVGSLVRWLNPKHNGSKLAPTVKRKETGRFFCLFGHHRLLGLVGGRSWVTPLKSSSPSAFPGNPTASCE